MEISNEEKDIYIEAKRKVRRIKVFYLHLVLYLIVVALICYNFYIMEGPYTKIITGLNITVLVFWTIAIILNAVRVFKGRLFFKKSWEDRKIEEIVNKDKEVETTFWE
ncbi:2TM domain-containing protein [Winogradskyella pulchriflava]|uniref:2TM domain-containing protein n=1 Tax=Winogradskyella pulchriflava TaxID=1110688 RepID=A0ABV6QAV3_9FLAO